MDTNKNLRVWHIPQVPGKPFHVFVDSFGEAVTILEVLAKYDLFQYENRIKPDYANAQGLELLVDGEWREWEDEDGYAISEQ